MNRFKNRLIAAVALSVLAITGTIMNSRQTIAQNGGNTTPVKIVSPLPVPVTLSSTSVSGTVAATQSGTWNVGITGQPTFRSVDEPARNGFVLDLSTGVATVPPTQRWVIESFSGSCSSVNSNETLTDISVLSRGVSLASTQPHLVQPNGGSNGQAVSFRSGSGLTRLYLGPNTSIGISFTTSAGAANSGDPGCFSALVSGYAVNLP